MNLWSKRLFAVIIICVRVVKLCWTALFCLFSCMANFCCQRFQNVLEQNFTKFNVASKFGTQCSVSKFCKTVMLGKMKSNRQPKKLELVRVYFVWDLGRSSCFIIKSTSTAYFSRWINTAALSNCPHRHEKKTPWNFKMYSVTWSKLSWLVPRILWTEYDQKHTTRIVNLQLVSPAYTVGDMILFCKPTLLYFTG